MLGRYLFILFLAAYPPPTKHGTPRERQKKQGAHTFCCGLEEVPSGDWFCPDCEARREAEARRREADARRDAILHRAWAVDSGSEGEGEGEGEEESVSTEANSRRRGLPAEVAVPVTGGASGGGAGTTAAAGAGVERGGRRRRAAAAAAVAALRTASLGGGGGDASAAAIEVESSRSSSSSSSCSSSSSDGDDDEEFQLRGSGAEDNDVAEEEKEEAEDAGGTRDVRSSRSRSSSAEARALVSRGETDGGGRLAYVSPSAGDATGVSVNGGDAIGGGSGTGGGTSTGNRRGSSQDGSSGGDSRRPNSRGGRDSSSSGGGGGAVASNFWPRVLASATSSVTPRHIFGDELGEEELASSDGDERLAAGAAGVVAQSWADAKLAQQVRTCRTCVERQAITPINLSNLHPFTIKKAFDQVCYLAFFCVLSRSFRVLCECASELRTHSHNF